MASLRCFNVFAAISLVAFFMGTLPTSMGDSKSVTVNGVVTCTKSCLPEDAGNSPTGPSIPLQGVNVRLYQYGNKPFDRAQGITNSAGAFSLTLDYEDGSYFNTKDCMLWLDHVPDFCNGPVTKRDTEPNGYEIDREDVNTPPNGIYTRDDLKFAPSPDTKCPVPSTPDTTPDTTTTPDSTN